MISTVIIFIIILGLLVFVHEFGHFYAAKKSGMRVLEFGFGFPPRLLGAQKVNGKWRIVWGHKDPTQSTSPHPSTHLAEGASQGASVVSSPLRGEEGGGDDSTIYSINAIPLGGFVKIWGENNEYENDPRSFISRPFWNRFATLVAGVVMNVVLAWVLLSAGFMAGMPTAVESLESLPKSATLLNPHVGVLEVLEKSPAQAAGLMPDDLILGVDGQKFYTASGFQEYIRANKGKVFEFNIQRGGEEKTIRVESLANPGENEGPTGIAIADVGNLRFTPFYAVIYGAKATGIQLYGIGKGLVGLFGSGMGLKALGGPVKIAQVTGRAAEMGFIYLLQFTSFLSLNLAILNILPFPALDGGRVLFLIIEKIRGVRNNPKVEQAFNAAGFALLILLMILVTIKDVRGI